MRSTFCDGFTRRDLLHLGVMAGTGLTLSNFLRLADAAPQQKRSADAVLFINLAGGPSHYETLDMKPEAPEEIRGSFKSIQSSLPGLDVCEYLPKFSRIADQFTLIRGISHTSGAHPQGQSYISTGNKPVPALIYPSFGSVVAKEMPAPPDLPSYVAVPNTEWTAGYMGDAYAALKTNEVPKPGQPFQVRGISLGDGLTVEKVNRRQELLGKLDRTFREVDTNSQLLEALDKFGRQAHNMITSARAQAAFDVSQEPPALVKHFAEDDMGQSLLLACRLIEFGVPFVTVTNAGWDTHLDNFDGHKRLVPALDNGIAAAFHALQEKGLLERTLVIVMGEFGRTPTVNQNMGRDHYPRVNWSLMAGGGVKPGQIIGGTDKEGRNPSEGVDISPDDVAASIYHSLGIDPRLEYHTKTGRPVMLVPHGEVIDGLFA